MSLVERKSKFYLIRKVTAKNATEVSRAMNGILWPIAGRCTLFPQIMEPNSAGTSWSLKS